MDAGKIIGIAIGLFVAAAILPTAILGLANTTTGGPWTGASTTILTLVPIIGVVAVAGLVYWIYKEFT